MPFPDVGAQGFEERPLDAVPEPESDGHVNMGLVQLPGVDAQGCEEMLFVEVSQTTALGWGDTLLVTLLGFHA